MPVMTNHGFYLSFRRTQEEQAIVDISEENAKLKAQIEELTSKVDSLANTTKEETTTKSK
jgi:hypothetical protein